MARRRKPTGTPAAAWFYGGSFHRHDPATLDEARRRAEHESGGALDIRGLLIEQHRRDQEEQARREETRRLTDAIRAIWERFLAGVRWSDNCRKRGDLKRAELSAAHEWRRVERAMAALGETPANDPKGPRPALKLLAGEHPAFDGPAPANDQVDAEHPMHGGPLGPCARTDEELTAVELPVLGAAEVA